ncbi:Uncharacterized conserved protein YafD, endonuclease/exonuclease/phosphatase (EEP) superfamily [Moheibacter sediminis]|uniref:Uncharacterized conserved protein YafD, endonuclease/exonuclease/phosphatase (EEP) superfamily n=2 Tax=Moheibacter sediminis TaxID=1434700 RepID=A0A1W1ZYB0_9FLAO|nr:Uncharacterized conserved protein YafD, endonuclease/exonuclease/phosphatase (EEP) superfamily [Moheibacter sediminis]
MLIDFENVVNLICLILLFVSLIYIGWIVFPYSIFSKKMVELDPSKSPSHKIKLLTINVYQHNDRYTQTLQCIFKSNPDVVFLLETNQDWKDSVQSVKEKYPYFIEIPKENTYGLLFYSKFPIEKQEINYLIDDEIPSIIVDINANGKMVRLYGIHPTPPVPQENPESTDRDAEILIMGKKSKEYEGPSIVFGDLNDVAWSHTTRLFLRISGMLDPRIGRGMYSTFHAKYALFRWPLDHFFVSSHFRLLDLRVEQGVGSDHFPISVSLSIKDEDKEKELEASSEDHEEVKEIIEEAKN